MDTEVIICPVSLHLRHGPSPARSERTAAREGPQDMGATATVEIDTERDRDDQAIFERAMAVNKVRRGATAAPEGIVMLRLR